jgi:hypothetical protein
VKVIKDESLNGYIYAHVVDVTNQNTNKPWYAILSGAQSETGKANGVSEVTTINFPPMTCAKWSLLQYTTICDRSNQEYDQGDNKLGHRSNGKGSWGRLREPPCKCLST